ncbi:MAG: phenylalanine--tRNA ligase subunit beta [Clostridia bacterium]|nr:phenylalanine--tRNA ligase subunit beta [Clostridia bacterium]
MFISLSWLKYYVEIPVPVEELCDKMVMAGFEVEEIVDLSKTMSNVVTGKIVKLEKHPDADKLQICQIDVGGDELIQIVTGASNVFEGAVVPVAMHDSHLPNGMHIKKGKLRGIPSNGMLCSGEELCIKDSDYPGAEVYGILILKEDTAVGVDMREILHLNDYVIDFKITANRPDCQSVLGVAREVAVVLGTEFKMPQPKYETKGNNINDLISVEVKDYDLCARYIGRCVNNLRIKESPEWLKLCLRAAGMRPINNIVDITNFVMLETGQPMHAFDRRDIAGNQIIVRRAQNGEQITTLDEKEHTLNDSMLVIADGEKPSCLAGIMGSLNSEIKEDTKDLFLESARFRRDNVRKTARALGIRTESSARFEKGIDVFRSEYAMERALQLIYDLDAGDIVDGTIDCNNGLPETRTITVSAQSINDLLGVEVPFDKMVEILNSLELETTLTDGMLTCKIPTFREDIEGRADLAEEVMRIYGYDHIIGRPMRGAVIRGNVLPTRKADDKVKTLLCSNSMHEITTYSFFGSKAIDVLNLAKEDIRRNAITIRNPLGDEYSTMRTQLVTSMLSVMATNISRKNPDSRFFELSRIYLPKALPLTEQPEERATLCIGLYGQNEDFFTLKGLVEQVLDLFGVKADYAKSSEPYYHPGRQAFAEYNGIQIAKFGEIHPATAGAVGIDQKVYVAEIDMASLYTIEKEPIIYRPISQFPAITRDIALICDRATPVATLEKAIASVGSKLIQSIRLFDVYEGNQIDADKKSVAYSIVLQSDAKTLTDEECNAVMNKVFRALEQVGAHLRT